MANLADVSMDGEAKRIGRLVGAARTRLFEVAILLWSLPFGVLILTLFQVWRPPHVVRRALRLWSTGFIAAARWIVGVRYVIEGRENIPDAPAIFVCNHQSYWESIALTALIADINVVSKAEATGIPVFGWGLRHAPMIFVNRDRRGTNLRRVLREAKATLSEGRSILIFPEGTRVPPGGRRTFERGLEALYRSSGVPVIPIVHNAGLLWLDGFRTKIPGLVTLRFCTPVEPGQSSAALMQELEVFINVEKDRLLSVGLQMDQRPFPFEGSPLEPHRR